MRAHRSFVAALLLAGCAVADGSPSALRPEPVAQHRANYGDYTDSEVIADAPWRVQNLDTVIPFELLFTDSFWKIDADLNWIEIRLRQDSGQKRVYFRSFGGFDLADYNPHKDLTHIHIDRCLDGDFSDGVPITARTLVGDAATGKTLEFIVEADVGVYSRFNSNLFVLRVVVGEPLPHGYGRFANWYAGDTHTHSMYTHNYAEYGPPHRALLAASKAMGLDWLITTDHSCDMDASYSYGVDIGRRIARYASCSGYEDLDACEIIDNSQYQNGLEMARADAKAAMDWDATGTVTLHAAEEVNVKSFTGKTIHVLAFDSPYIQSGGSGSTKAHDPVTVGLQDVVGSAANNAMLFASHPTQSLSPEINGGTWSPEDLDTGVAASAFLGLEFWNMRVTKRAKVSNPFDSYLGLDNTYNCSPSPECYPFSLDDYAIPLWDSMLSSTVKSGKRITAIAGSDAHGHFNFDSATDLGLNLDYGTDNALGKVRTVVSARSKDMSDVLDAIRKGRVVMTDGPMFTVGVDLTGDGTIDQEADAQVGATVEHPEGSHLEFVLKWQSTSEFGDISRIVLYRGTSSSGALPDAYSVIETLTPSPCDFADKKAASCRIDLGPSSVLAPPPNGTTYYYRAVAYSGSTQSYRCLTNPIWVKGAPPAPPPSEAGAACTHSYDCADGLTCVDNSCQSWCGLGWPDCPTGLVCDPDTSVCAPGPEDADSGSDESRYSISCQMGTNDARAGIAFLCGVLVILMHRNRRRG